MASVALKDLDGEICSVFGRPQDDDCLMFMCPVCKDDSGELKGHAIMVSFVPPSLFPSGAMWRVTAGSKVEDLTIEPSINCDVLINGQPSDCKFHGFVRGGRVVW